MYIFWQVMQGSPVSTVIDSPWDSFFVLGISIPAEILKYTIKATRNRTPSRRAETRHIRDKVKFSIAGYGH